MYYDMARFVYAAVASTVVAVHSATSQPRLRDESERGGRGKTGKQGCRLQDKIFRQIRGKTKFLK
jgi:hypothetical protein